MVILYTASYFCSDHHHGQLISISRSVPKGMFVAGHLDFFKPSREILDWWQSCPKNEVAWSKYTSQFWALLAERKNLILDWIHSLGQRPEQDLTLCCWEKTGQKCHRNLVARLLQKHCPEQFGGCDLPQFQIGDKVTWAWAYGYLTFLEPFEIRTIEGDRAFLQWMYSSVKLAELKKIN